MNIERASRMPPLILPLLFLLLGITSAHAQSCNATVTSPFQFGGAGGPDILAGTTVDTTGTVTITCSGISLLTQVCVGIDAGTGGASGSTHRLMQGSGANQAKFQLYQDSSYSIPWGSFQTPTLGAAVGVLMPIRLLSDSVSTLTVYARLLAGQTTVPAGSYTTTLNTRLNYGLVSALLGCNGLLTTTNAGGSFVAQTTVEKNCRLSVSQNLEFGTVTVLNQAIDKQGTLSVTCTKDTVFNISLGPGSATGATTATRKMTRVGGGATIDYALYRASGASAPWGNTIGTDTYSGTGTGLAVSIPVYGRVPAQPTPVAADYRDNVVVTVTY
jgi:spore coat protein U-like protein